MLAQRQRIDSAIRVVFEPFETFNDEEKFMKENMKTNDQVNRDAASGVPTSETADGGSGSTLGSFSAIAFGGDQ